MVTLVKHEWHSVDSQYALELDIDMLSEIYPDLDEDELANLMEQIENGETSVDEIVEAAYDNGVDLEWDRQYDDWWTERKGGYDVTFELGDENSWHSPPPEPEDTHKCTKCKWSGQEYEADWVHDDLDIESTDEPKKVCPMCNSDLELTEHGQIEEEERKKRMAEIEAMLDEDNDE